MPLTFWMQDTIRGEIIEGISLSDPISTDSLNKLIELVKKGDTIAYENLFMVFLTTTTKEHSSELLIYSLLMANKYNYPFAYYGVYDCLWQIYPETTSSLMLLDSLDETTRNIALEYLQKGAELGENNCQYNLGRYYLEGKYFEKDTILGKKLIDRSRGRTVK